MDFKNLYSLLSSPWLINDRAGNSLLPVLFTMLERGETDIKKKELSFSLYSSSGKSVKSISPVFGENEPDNSIVAILPIEGTIMKYSGMCSYGTQHYKKVMEQWIENKAIAGVVLDIESGGGSVSGTPEFSEYIQKYPKPVVAFTNGMMCSAAYYIAAGAKEIMASNYIDVIGSIGTLYRTLDFTGKYEKEGIRVIEAYASPSTNKNGAIRAAMDKENPSNVRIIEELLDPTNNRFIAFIKNNRKTISEEALTGMEYISSEEALKNGLIDRIGTLEEAVTAVFELQNEQNNNPNNNDMSEKTYPKIASILNLSELRAKGGLFLGTKAVSLSEEQLDKIEANVQEDQSSVIEQLSDDNKKLKTKAEELEKLKAAVQQSLTDHSLQSTGSGEGDIQLLSEKITEYGSKDGDTPTQVHSQGDQVETSENPDDAILNEKIITP